MRGNSSGSEAPPPVVVAWLPPGIVAVWLGSAALVCGLVRGDGLVLLFGLLALGLVALARWMAPRNGRGLRVERRVPARVTAGLSFGVELAVSAPRAGTRRALNLVDVLAGTQAPALWLSWVPRRGVAAGRLEGRRWQRGRVMAKVCLVVSRYPLGFFEMRTQVPVGGDAGLLVLPRALMPPHLRAALELARWEAPMSARHPLEGQGEYRGLRDYRHGDPLRSVSWRASARRERLLVREWDPPVPRPARLGVVLHHWSGGRRAVIRPEHWEQAIGLVVGIARHAAAEGIGLRVFTPGLPAKPVRVPEQMPLGDLLAHLALVDRRPGMSLEELAGACEGMRDCDRIFLVGDAPGGLWEEALLAALPPAQAGRCVCLDGAGPSLHPANTPASDKGERGGREAGA